MKVDIAIIGAGPAGTGTCAYLGDKAKSIAVINDRPSSAVFFSGAVLSPKGSQFKIPEDRFNEAVEKFNRFLSESYPMQHSEKPENIIVESGGVIPSTLWMETSKFASVSFLLHKKVLFLGISSLPSFIPELSIGRLKRHLGHGTEYWESKTIDLPLSENDVEQTAIGLSKTLDNEKNFGLFKESILGLRGIENYDAVLIPPILGIKNFLNNLYELRKLLKPAFSELLSGIPSTNGVRLQIAIENYLKKFSIKFIKSRCSGFTGKEKIEALRLDPINKEVIEIEPEAVIYAPGRFTGDGIRSHDDLRESLFGLPLYYKNNRLSSHLSSLFSYNIYDIQPGLEATIRINESLQPIKEDGKIFAKNLFCAGSLLLGQSGILQAFASGSIAGGIALCV